MLHHLKRHFFFYAVLLLLLISVSASLFRFLVIYDYEVTYEGDCDPYTESCFVYCEDDRCMDPFYYSWITAPANLIEEMCGDDVTSCDFAYSCLDSGACSVEYCDTDTDDCDQLGPADRSTL